MPKTPWGVEYGEPGKRKAFLEAAKQEMLSKGEARQRSIIHATNLVQKASDILRRIPLNAELLLEYLVDAAGEVSTPGVTTYHSTGHKGYPTESGFFIDREEL